MSALCCCWEFLNLNHSLFRLCEVRINPITLILGDESLWFGWCRVLAKALRRKGLDTVSIIGDWELTLESLLFVIYECVVLLLGISESKSFTISSLRGTNQSHYFDFG